MTYTTKLITGIRWQFRKKSIARVFREIWSDMKDALLAFPRGLLCVMASPVFLLLSPPLRLLVWMLSPFVCPFMKVNTEVWVSLDSTLKK